MSFSEKFEGSLRFMYLDVKGLVTTGIGNLIDSVDEAMALPFCHPDGTPAARSEIAIEWRAVKARQDWKLRGGGVFGTITRLRLTPAGVESLVLSKLDLNDRLLEKRFPDLPDWPADAQLALHSLAWACGTAFRFPKLEAALKARDWAKAAVECRMNEAGNPGLKPRNVANKLLFENAAKVSAPPPDLETLHYPDRL